MKTGEYYLTVSDSGYSEYPWEGPFKTSAEAVSALRTKTKEGDVQAGDVWGVVRVQKVIRVKSKPVLFTEEEPELEDSPGLVEQPTPRFPSDVTSPAL